MESNSRKLILGGDKGYLKAFLALIDKIFYLRLAPAIAMISVSQKIGRSIYKAVVHNGAAGDNIVSCNFRTRVLRGKLSPKECRWEVKIKIASPYGKGTLSAISFFPSMSSSAYYGGRDYSEVVVPEGDSGFSNAVDLANKALNRLPEFASTEDFAAAMYEEIRQALGYKDLPF